MFNVTVKTLDSKDFAFELPDDITVEDFKNKVSQKLDISVDKLRIIFRGKIINDALKKLIDFGVSNQVLHIVEREPIKKSTRTPTSVSSSSRGAFSQSTSNQQTNAIPASRNASSATVPHSEQRLNVAYKMLKKANSELDLLDRSHPNLRSENLARRDQFQHIVIQQDSQGRILASVLSKVLSYYLFTMSRLSPYIEETQSFLSSEENLSRSEALTSQNLYNTVSRIFHEVSHAQHAISDLVVDATISPPRFLMTAIPFGSVISSNTIRSNALPVSSSSQVFQIPSEATFAGNPETFSSYANIVSTASTPASQVPIPVPVSSSSSELASFSISFDVSDRRSIRNVQVNPLANLSQNLRSSLRQNLGDRVAFPSSSTSSSNSVNSEALGFFNFFLSTAMPNSQSTAVSSARVTHPRSIYTQASNPRYTSMNFGSIPRDPILNCNSHHTLNNLFTAVVQTFPFQRSSETRASPVTPVVSQVPRASSPISNNIPSTSISTDTVSNNLPEEDRNLQDGNSDSIYRLVSNLGIFTNELEEDDQDSLSLLYILILKNLSFSELNSLSNGDQRIVHKVVELCKHFFSSHFGISRNPNKGNMLHIIEQLIVDSQKQLTKFINEDDISDEYDFSEVSKRFLTLTFTTFLILIYHQDEEDSSERNSLLSQNSLISFLQSVFYLGTDLLCSVMINLPESIHRLSSNLLNNDVLPLVFTQYASIINQNVEARISLLNNNLNENTSLINFILRDSLDPSDERESAAVAYHDAKDDTFRQPEAENTSYDSDNSSFVSTSDFITAHDHVSNAKKSDATATDLNKANGLPNGKEDSWKNELPSEWVPIISEDTKNLNSPTVMRPLSSAYLAGMPFKKRKIVEKEQTAKFSIVDANKSLINTIRQCVNDDDSVKQEISKQKFEELSKNISDNIILEKEIKETVFDSLRSRISTDSDFDDKKFPNLDKIIKKMDKDKSNR